MSAKLFLCMSQRLGATLLPAMGEYVTLVRADHEIAPISAF